MTDLAAEHLRLRLAGLHRALRVAALLTRPNLTPYCVGVLLDEVGAFADAMTEPGAGRDLRRWAAAEGVTFVLWWVIRR
ncbi:hypothetical protein [Amycolatopsis sp. WGS_07]|uniref:hypothetical protein n=1 Tax=Amycolatopsis sp. WGS_07 TaxID=3076764 RepID=UPI0038732E20